MLTFTTFLTAFAATALVLPLIRKLALKAGVLDYPGGRKVHDKITPLLGGAGIFCGLLTGMWLNLGQFKAYAPLFIGACGIFFIGLIEDIRGLSALTRLLLQILVSLVVVRMGLSTGFLPDVWWGQAGNIIISVLWITGLTNAYNYLDGLDGLAAGSAVINLFFFALMLYASGQYPAGLISVSLIASCLAFLPFNFSSYKMFLGEAGSTLLGFSIAGIGLMGSWAPDRTVKLLIPVLILGVPIFDMIFTTIMRVREGRVKTILEWLRYGGRDHFHHYLVDLGLSRLKAVFFIYSITFVLGISAFMLGSYHYIVKAGLALLQALLVFGGIAVLMVVGKRRRSGWQDKQA